MKNWGIEARVLFVALVPGAVVAFALAAYFLAVRYGDTEKELVSRGQALARQLAQAAEYGAFSGNVVELRRLAVMASRESDVTAITFADRDGTPWVIAGSPQVQAGRPGRLAGKPATAPDGMTLAFDARIETVPTLLDESSPSSQQPETPESLGTVHVEMSRHQVETRKWEILGVTAGLFALLMVAAGFLARRLGRDVTNPLRDLEKVVSDIRIGRLDARVPPHPSGTLRILEDGVNAMAAALAAARQRSESALADSEAALRRQHEFADALLKAQSDAGIATVVVEDGRVVYSNPAMRLMSGYSEVELTQMPSFIQLIHPNAHGFILENYKRRLSGEAVDNRYEIPYVNRQGEVRYAEVSIARIPTAGGNGVLVVAFDSTKRKLDEERLALAHAELREQKEAAERGSLAKSRFLAAASHDLRQPLHALSLFASELEAISQPAQRRLVQQIGTAAESMHEMLAALLDISRIDLAGLEPKVLSFPLAPFLEKVVAGHVDQARRKNLRIALVPCSVWAMSDPRLLERIVANLLSNAIRYTADGGIAMGVRRAGKNLRLEIWDTGIGMEERHIPLVFQEFYQVANPERDARKGLGLGLSIVDRLAQALAHPIRVRSVPERGSVFSVELPRALPQSPPLAKVAAHEAEAHSEVLVVAPADQERTRICEKLIEWGIHVTAVATPAGALRTAAGAALIICDESLLEILAAQMSASGLPPPPLLVIGSPTGMDAPTHIAKPVRPAKLRALLQHLLPEAFSGTDG